MICGDRGEPPRHSHGGIKRGNERVREVRSHYYDCLDRTCPTPTQAALSGGHAEEGTLGKLCNFSRPPRLTYNVGLRPRSGRFHKEKVKHTVWSLVHCKHSTG